MAENETIVSGMAGRYAQALFSLAEETHATDAVGAQLAQFEAAVAGSADLARLVKSPVFTAQEQVAALDKILPLEGIDGLAAKFIKLVADKRRLFAIGDMIHGFTALSDAKKGIARAQVTVAEPLSEAHLTALKQALEAVTGGKDVAIAMKIDPAIIGGLIVQVGSRMVDGSLRTKLNAIRTRMKEVS